MNKFHFNFPDGRHLTWYECGEGRPLVLLHGWAMSAAVFSEIATLLAGDFRLLIPDLPGHGESSLPLQTDLATLSGELSCWLSEVAGAGTSVAGWSLGGMLALELAQNEKLSVERLILIGTTPQFTSNDKWPFGLPATQVHVLARNLRRRFEPTLGDFFELTFEGEKISRERLREIRRFAVMQSPVPERETVLGFLQLLSQQDQRAMIAGILQPSLVLHGALDKIVPVEAGRSLAETLPHGRFVELQGVGHAPFLSRPEAVADEIRGFVNGTG